MEDFEKFYNRALRFLAYRPRSEKEIRDYLMRHSGKRSDSRIKNGFWTSQNDDRELIIEKVIAKLREQKLIDDGEFVKWWIESRSRFKPKSIRLIKSELRYKGISNELVDRIVHNSEFIIQNDLEQAKKLVEKRMSRYKDLSKEEIYQKLVRFLASRGFDWDTIKQSIDELVLKRV